MEKGKKISYMARTIFLELVALKIKRCAAMKAWRGVLRGNDHGTGSLGGVCDLYKREWLGFSGFAFFADIKVFTNNAFIAHSNLAIINYRNFVYLAFQV